MGNCKDCKFWGNDRARECGYSDWRNQESSFDIEVGALDDSGLYAYLITGPEFGCVQFSPKKKKKNSNTKE